MGNLPEKLEEDVIIINHRRKNKDNLKLSDNLQNSTKDLGDISQGEKLDKNLEIKIKQNSHSEKKNIEIDFDNCDVYLKNNNNTENMRPHSRKRSAYKFIEENLDNQKQPKNLNNFNSTNNIIKSLNFNEINNTNKPFNGNYSNNTNKNPINSQVNNISKNKEIENKPIINIDQNKNNQNLFANLNNKKPEYESRRKNKINFLNDMENNINTNNSNNIPIIGGSNNNNLVNFEMQQKNVSKINKEQENFSAIGIGNYESRRLQQGNYQKNPVIHKDKKV